MTPIKNELGTVFIHVKDLKKSVNWYSQILGFDVDLNEVKFPVSVQLEISIELTVLLKKTMSKLLGD